LITEESTPTSPDADTFIIHDNSSEMAKFIPEKYVEPLVIIARVQGFDRIDDYIIHLIKDRLEMFTDTRDDLENAFQQYMHNMIIGKDVPNTWKRATSTLSSHSTTTKAEDELDDDTTKEEEDTKEEENGERSKV
jgi:hypothetical protein